MLRTSYLVLLLGVGLVLSGFALGVYSVVTFNALAEDSLITYKNLKPQSVQAGMNITTVFPAKVGDSFRIKVTKDPTEVPLNVQIRDRNENIVNQSDGHRIIYFTATVQGTQRLVVVNEGTKVANVAISIRTEGLSGFPFIDVLGIAGLIIIVGIIILVVGGVKFIKEWRGRSPANFPPPGKTPS